MNKIPSLRIITIAVAAAALSGCLTPPMYDQICAEEKADKKTIEAHKPYDTRKEKTVFCNKGLYVDPTPISLKQAPAWLNEQVSLRGKMLPLDFYMKDLLKGTNGLVLYQEPSIRNTLLSFEFQGTLKGALDYIAAQTNYAYDVSGRTVSWSRFVTKTFDIAFMPGSTTYLLGQQASTGGGPTGTGSTNPNGSSTGGLVITGSSSATDQYSNISAKLSIWDDLRNTIKNLLSPEGRATISESTTSITVQDRPANLVSIEKYLSVLNKELSRQVLIKVQVIEFTSQKGFNYGIDWNMIAGSLGVQGVMAQPVNIAGFDSTNSPALSWVLLPAAKVAQAAGGPPAPTKAFLNALNEQGEATTVTQPSMVTLNNQVAELNINTQTGYLAEVTTTVTGTAGTAQTALTPGIVNSGFTFALLPKIQGNNIYLQINGNLSSLPTFTEARSGGQSISTPTMNEKRINQRTVVPSGGTLVLAGYRQVNTQTGKNSFLGLGLLGGVGAKRESGEAIILITPIILDTVAQE